MLAAILARLLPIAFRAVEQGVAFAIVAKLAELAALILPLVEDADTRAEIAAALDDLNAFAPRPAQPEDPAMARAAGHTGMGGR
jgi:hypothetical protein